jgi:hypothetical protein
MHAAGISELSETNPAHVLTDPFGKKLIAPRRFKTGLQTIE